ncbi:hypothetical protein A3C86_03395 [Candidatus Kaiserbacteria bacterium RIFCSPHIGHO2_02_FULL_49_16]|uniref:Integral membrane protein (PIN domain superfamily) n=1 Tax=Candidatus Kaiserbacteria bacterium RIFCSPHIGHO2_02_FULL_49_16 TaxID=1798490 RepID=A0A1F6DBU8_9BACT|nr:MAG: hypothetical protein A3C86_03395 [Candidatus Kaiserbacteria bacterium RIFCSPHIGHO2_02_FULL_49_16]
MDDSLIAAKLLGTYLIISGLFLILRGKTLPNIIKDFLGHPAIVYLTGIFLIVLSSLYIIQNNIWDGTWRTAVTVLAWAVFLKGVAYIFVPETLHKVVSKKFLASVNLYGLVAVILGLSLLYIG